MIVAPPIQHPSVKIFQKKFQEIPFRAPGVFLPKVLGVKIEGKFLGGEKKTIPLGKKFFPGLQQWPGESKISKTPEFMKEMPKKMPPLLRPQQFFHGGPPKGAFEGKTSSKSMEFLAQNLLKPLYKNPLMGLMWVWPHLVGSALKNICWPIGRKNYGYNGSFILYIQVKRGSELWVSQSLHGLKKKIETHWACHGRLELRLVPSL